MFTNDPVDLRRVNFHFLSLRESDPGVTALNEVLCEWQECVSKHPETYGAVRMVSPLSTPVNRDRICRYVVCDLSAANEYAVIALLLLIDERFVKNVHPTLLVLGAELPWRERDKSSNWKS